VSGPQPIDLLVVGELNPDILVIGEDPTPAFGQQEKLVSAIRLEIGSSSAIMACGAARLGLRVAFVGVVGDDAMGRFMLTSLAERGIDTSQCVVDPAIPTGSTLILSRGEDRASLTAIGTIDRVRGEHVADELLGRARHLHLGSTGLVGARRAALPELLTRARASGVTTSFDPGGDPDGRWEGTNELLEVADITLPNLAEARAISGVQEPEAAARELARRGRPELVVAVKMGGAGAIAAQGDRVIRQAAARTVVLDSTGAGDSFDAGFVAAWVSGWPLDEALALGVACGSLSTRGIGGTDAQPTLDEAAAEMRSLPS
jgi:sugar/nucleoside kinase (ribokinase family)